LSQNPLYMQIALAITPILSLYCLMTHQTNISTSSIKWLQINLYHSRLAALHYLSQILLDLVVDVAFFQEPYATSNPNIMIKYVDEDYVQLHSLSSDHAYGVAILTIYW
jgi:hypothetical protein